MAKTKIEWLRSPDGKSGYSINPIKGLCPMACPYCYARRMYKRFKWNPEIRFDDIFYYPGIPGKPGDKYFIGSTMELFGDWVRPEWLADIFRWVRAYPQRTFIFLTKKPEKLHLFNPYPPNCYVGVSVTNQEQYDIAIKYLRDIDVKTKFLSFEPLLERITL